jgi:hypothetical protein
VSHEDDAVDSLCLQDGMDTPGEELEIVVDVFRLVALAVSGKVDEN